MTLLLHYHHLLGLYHRVLKASFRSAFSGHCRVPHGYSANKKLAWWVRNLRAQYQNFIHGKTSRLTFGRVRMLEDVGFEWAPIEGDSYKTAWTERQLNDITRDYARRRFFLRHRSRFRMD